MIANFFGSTPTFKLDMAKKMNVSIKQAVILAGGAGTRLRPFTLTKPKPMYPVNGKPFLEHLLSLLGRNGITEVVLLTGYKSKVISDYFKEGRKFGVNIKYSTIPYLDKKGNENLNGLRLRKAFGLLDKNFLMVYCDNYWPLELNKMVAAYNKNQTPALIAVYSNKYGLGEYGFENNIMFDSKKLVVKYDKSRKDGPFNGLDIGTFILNKTLLNSTQLKNFSFEKEIIPKLIRRKQLSVYVNHHRYYFITNNKTARHMHRFLKPKKVVFISFTKTRLNMPTKEVFKLNSKLNHLPKSLSVLQPLINMKYHLYLLNPYKKQGPLNELLYRTSNKYHIDLTKSIFITNDKAKFLSARRVGCSSFFVGKTNKLKDIVELINKK